MDKYEYKVLSEEIKQLINHRSFAEAARIADRIDWGRVKNIEMLCKVSDVYKANRRFEDAKELLLKAYDRNPGGRMIVYSLCELCIKMDEVVQAVEFYKEFIKLDSRNNKRYILLYKIYTSQEVSLEERIEVLEELKAREYSEKWGYELAYLYHRIGLVTKCIEECDELFIYFGDGRYVKKALDLKQLHKPLTNQQKSRYYGEPESIAELIEEDKEVNSEVDQVDENNQLNPKSDSDDIFVKPVDVSQYNTINLQQALADSMQDVLVDEESEPVSDSDMSLEAVEYTNTVCTSDDTDSIEVPIEASNNYEYAQELIIDRPNNDFISADTREYSTVFELDKTSIESEPNNTQGLELSDDNNLLQEFDGQLKIAVNDANIVEKQITGQLKIDDILLGWENIIKENERKRREEYERSVLQVTGPMFTQFDIASKSGVLAQLQDEVEVIVPSRPEIIYNEPGLQDKSTGIRIIPNDVDGVANSDELLDSLSQSVAEEGTFSIDEQEDYNELESIEDTTDGDLIDDISLLDDGTNDREEIEQLDDAKYDESELTDNEAELEVFSTSCSNCEELNEELAVYVDDNKSEDLKAEGLDDVTDDVLSEEIRDDASKEARTDSERNSQRELTDQECGLFAEYIHTKNTKYEFTKAIDSISLGNKNGNLIVTGDEGVNLDTLAKNVVKLVQIQDKQFNGKVVRVKSEDLSGKNLDNMVDKINNGAVVISRAGDMGMSTLEALKGAVMREDINILLILLDTKRSIKKMIARYPSIEELFDAKIDVATLGTDELVKYGEQYAKRMEYIVDELARLALHAKIDSNQTVNHSVTKGEVKTIIDMAIKRVNRKNPRHLVDILIGKRYGDEDMIILREQDFK